MNYLHLLLFLVIAGPLFAQKTANLSQAQAFAQAQTVAFEENKGQVWNNQNQPATAVKYHLQQQDVDIFMLPTGLAYQFNKVHYPAGYNSSSTAVLSPEEETKQQALQEKIYTETYRMDMELVGANAQATIVAEGKSKDYVQYYNRDALNVHSFKKLTYQGIYPGIDWVIYTTQEGIKYDFILHQGADPSRIQMRFKDQEQLVINKDGSFTLSNSMGSITEQAPVSFQNGQVIPTSFY